MMEESLHGEYRLSSLDHRHDERRRAGRWYGATVVRTIDGTVQQEWPLWPLLDVPLTGRAPRRAETSYIAALSIVWRIVAAIRLWRGRPFAAAIARAQRPPAQGHRPQREDLGYDLPQRIGMIRGAPHSQPRHPDHCRDTAMEPRSLAWAETKISDDRLAARNAG
jgi:hypothetical protein